MHDHNLGRTDIEESFSESQESSHLHEVLKGVARFWDRLEKKGLGESALRIGSSVLTISLFLIVIWIMGNFYLRVKNQPASTSGSSSQSSQVSVQPTSITTMAANLPPFVIPTSLAQSNGIPQRALIHTILPSRPRFDVTTYTVQSGDTIYGIAEKFALKPESIMWGNTDILVGSPDLISPGTQLFILPEDGAYHKWIAGEGLNAVASFFNVTPQDIIDWPGNNLTPESVGDLAHPNIAQDAMIFIPGGYAAFIDFTPVITRSNPAVAYVLGPGSCGSVSTGAVGTGTFIWPSRLHTLSGYYFDPSINHFGIDEAGALGYPIYASDGGVVVYAGWSDVGYGNLIIIDHGTGWQSLYSHLSEIDVSCGQSVSQGDTIGLMGSTGNSTGPHLHFELRSATYGRVDPLPLLY